MADLYGIGNALLNIGTFGLNNLISNWQSSQTSKRNFEYNERAAQNADARTRRLYNDLYSPNAQMQQIKDAGLSPSVFYGGTPGQGGTTGAMGSGANGPGTPFAPMSIVDAAQSAALFAQADKTKAETKQIEPTAKATISSLLAEAGYKNASASAAKAQTAGIELDNYVKNNTKEASIYTICELSEKAAHEATKTFNEMRSAKIAADLDEETFKDKIEIAHEQLNQIIQSICESKSAEKLNEIQKKYLRFSMLDAIDNANREWAKYNLSVEQFETFLDKQIPILEKEIELKLKDLNIQNKKLIIDGITNSVRAIMTGVAATSLGGKLGKGGYKGPQQPQVVIDNTIWNY